MLNPHTGVLTIVFYDTASTTTEYLPETHAERYNKLLPDPMVECVTPLEGRYFTPRKIAGRTKILGVDADPRASDADSHKVGFGRTTQRSCSRSRVIDPTNGRGDVR